MPAPPATPVIPPVYGMPAQPGVAMPAPVYSAPAQVAPMAPPMYGMPAQHVPVMPHPPAVPAPPAAALNLPATPVARPQPASSNLVLYVVLGALFVIALFLVIFFALKT